jgi:WS/DGAT/MGAT family acyltransferase
MAEPLSPSDRSSLTAERGPINMTVGGVLVFERGKGVSYDAVVERIESRLHLIPRYRQRLEQPPLGLANPVWVDDEHFDVRWHVRRVALPPPGGLEELSQLVGQEFSRRLDRSRPLWELLVIEGLPRGRVALLPKMHHALVDGMAAIGIGMVLLDPSPVPLDLEPPAEAWKPQPYAVRRHLTRLAQGQVNRAQKLMMDGAMRVLDTSPMRAAGDLRRATELMSELVRQRPQAPMTILNSDQHAGRSYAVARARLDDIKAAGRSVGGSVNDTILAAVAGMLRRYLEEAGSPAAGQPVALVPVSVRREGETELGNRISMVFVDLPIHESDPLERIRLINAPMTQLKDSAKIVAGAMLVGATGFAPPAVSNVLVRAMGNVRAFNLVVSNVPGPQQPFYMNGVRLLEVYPIVPPNPANQRLTLGVISYDGGVHFGQLADGTLEPGPDRAAMALEASIGELLAAARV